jgi:hypothetical protein
MANLASILTDPNYVNANPATKQAIFDKFSAQDTNFTNANPATQDAIRQKFGVSVAAAPQLPESLRPRTAASEGMPGARQELSTGQRVYQAARPFVAPIVEALGAGGGALLGGAAGTFGAGPIGTVAGGLAGGGLGYGIAKEGLELADVAMGVKQPRAGAAQVTEPLRNVAEGAFFEGAGKIAGPVIAKGVGKLADLRQIPKNKAADIARNALGPDLPEVLNALKAGQGKGMSAAHAAADINSPTFQALIDRATARDPRFLSALEKSQGDVSLNALSKLAGGRTAADVRATTQLAKENLNTITTPMRESSLARANLGKYVADESALREANDLATMVGSGGQLDPVRFAAQATGAEKALRSVGIKPLEGAPLAQRIASVAQNPQFAANDLIEGSVKQIADDIAKWTNSGGVIDANALEAIRKNSVTAAIAKLRPGMDATSQRNAAAGVLSRTKPLIDDAIEAAGGTGWRDYLTTHAKGMQKIAEKQLTGEALRLFKTDKNAFVRLVQNESPEAVEKILGPGKYNIAVELAENTLAPLENEAIKIIRNANIKSQVEGGQTALKELLLQNMSKFRLPSYLSAVAATTNKALNILETKIGTKTMDTLTKALQTPESAAQLLETLPAAERNRVLQLIADPAKWGAPTRAAVTGTTAAGVNMLAPERFVENEFVR